MAATSALSELPQVGCAAKATHGLLRVLYVGVDAAWPHDVSHGLAATSKWADTRGLGKWGV